MEICFLSLDWHQVHILHLKKKENVFLYFVDDGSTDNTLDLLNEMHQKNPRQIQVISLKKNKGKATAVKTGMGFCLNEKKCDRIAFLDADLSTSLESCFELAQKINTHTKFVFASRIRKIDNNIERRWYRFLMGRILATFISNMLNLAVYDTQCGCKIFKRELLPIAFKDPFLSRWLFDVEIFYRLKNHYSAEQLKSFSKEIPLASWVDQGGSKIKLSYGLFVWGDLYNIYRFYR